MAVSPRTVIASLALPASAVGVPPADRSVRKVQAVQRAHAAEDQLEATLEPKLRQLRDAGIITRYEPIPLTGTVVIDLAADRFEDGMQALAGMHELDRFVEDSPIGTLDARMGAARPRVRPLVSPGPVEAWQLAATHAPQAWAAGATGQGVTIGFVDSGVDAAHPLLRDHYRGARADGTVDDSYAFFDAVNGRRGAYDDRGHGTMVVSAAVGGTAQQPLGIAPGARFMAAKVFSADGGGNLETTLRGLGWMLEPRDSDGQNPDATKAPDVLSASFGSRDGLSLKYLQAWATFAEAGITTVAAAGNGGPRPGTINAPGSYGQSITVGASTREDEVWAHSGRGPSPIPGSDTNPILKPDVVAPGVDVLVATPGGGMALATGTSLATPIAAGVASLAKSINPKLDPAGVRAALVAGAHDIDVPGPDYAAGHGRVDAAATVSTAIGGLG